MSTTTKKKRSRIIFAVDQDSKGLYVKLRWSGISPLVAMIDGLSLTFFGKGKTAYLSVETVLDWFKNELRLSPGSKRFQDGVMAYERILERFRNGEIQDEHGLEQPS